MRILFMGGHELGKITLNYLIKKGRNIIGVVVTDTEDEWYKGVDEIAQRYNLPLFKEKNINNKNFVRIVEELKPDLITVVNFQQILKDEIIKIPTKGCINTHASLLPKYRGRAPLNWAMINGEKETGVTVHYIDTGIDTGDIILQKKIKIEEDDYIGDLLDKIKKIYPLIVEEAIGKIQKDEVNPIKQDLSQGFYFGKRSPKDGQIKWNKPIIEIYNLIRAISKPYPGAYTYYNDDKIIIWRAELCSQSKNEELLENGTILEIKDKAILVKGNGGNLLITEYDFQSDDFDLVKTVLVDRFIYKEDEEC